MLFWHKWSFLLILLILLVVPSLCFGSGSSPSLLHDDHDHHHCNHHHNHKHDHEHHDRGQHENSYDKKRMLLPEELAEEEDMERYGFGSYHDHYHAGEHEHRGSSELSGLGLWLSALGCSLLVSLASFICLIILPVIFINGKPSKAVVDSLALFGAGAMLGDAFLHQLPHAFGGQHSHSHDHHADLSNHAHVGGEHSHSHSFKDLSVGMSVLSGIVLFLIVEKLVRYVDDNSEGATALSHSHHHHHHKSNHKLKDEDNANNEIRQQSAENESLHDESNSAKKDNLTQEESLRKRRNTAATSNENTDVDAADGFTNDIASLREKESVQSPSNLVFGYLNLFSDGVHNFTDGMALGSAFLLHGSVGGWSRTLFLLAHEIPQEVGDFGILVRSGFTIAKALFYNFLSALVALVGTALTLLLGQDPGQSSLIEGFTAGGFIYIAVAGVLAEMNNNGKTTLKSTIIQLVSLTTGMGVALCISLLE